MLCYSLPSSEEGNVTHASVGEVQSQTLPHRELLHCFWLPDAERGTPAQKVSSTEIALSRSQVVISLA